MDGLIYAYGQPRSNEQQRFIARRIAEQRKQRRASAAGTAQASTTSLTPSDPYQFVTHDHRSTLSSATNSPGVSNTAICTNPADTHIPLFDHGELNVIYRANTTSSAMSSQSEINHHQLLNQPFDLRHGRRYLRDVPYPLPCDLPEMQRQNLRTLLACQVFGRAVCSPRVSQDIPQKVLELGCGTGYWSTMCHDYFCSLGYDDVSFTGLDIAPLAPDLTQQGVNWTFVQHDFRRLPLPFEDGEFDLIMLKDLSLTLPFETVSSPSQRLTEESIRLLKAGGTLEVWESDHCLRCIVSSFHPDTNKHSSNFEALDRCGTFPITDATHFAPVQNKFLRQANDWIQQALGDRKLPPAPCARIAQLLLQEPDHLTDLGVKRVAIPLRTIRSVPDYDREDERVDSSMSKGKTKWSGDSLTSDQISLRQTALVTVLQFIENLEPVLRQASGKNADEWSHWWASMVSDLSDPQSTSLRGECLEIGAWWASKIDDS